MFPTHFEAVNLPLASVDMCDNVSLPCSSDVSKHAKLIDLAKEVGVPVINVTPDSGATASNTNDCSNLVNTKPCNEIFGDAHGKLTYATAVGDLPVIARNGDGLPIAFTLTNVRCVPDFKYTLLSVKQMWAEQRIDCRWRDLNRLELPHGEGIQCVPFEPSYRLSTITLIPGATIAKTAPAVAKKWFGPLASKWIF